MADEREALMDLRMRACLHSIVGPLVAEGRATLDFDTDAGPTHWVRPARQDALPFGVVLQSEYEISFFPEDPSSGRGITVDLFDKAAHGLSQDFEDYVRAILAGRVELTTNTRGAGRFVVVLDDGSERAHLYNVLFGFRVGRGSNWRTFRPAAY